LTDISLPVEEQFQGPQQQRRADALGMWLFLSSEAMMFGAFFLALIFYRVSHPEASREASEHLAWMYGGSNTAVLLTSSFTMAVAVGAARHARERWVWRCLVLTAAIGVVFLLIKGFEYRHDFEDGIKPGLLPSEPLHYPAAQLIVNLYYVSTALHALHLSIGILLVAGLAWRVAKRQLSFPERTVTVEMIALYWNFVDVVWMFLFAILYLWGR
jgi:cytochrome c oxidase subunit 3